MDVVLAGRNFDQGYKSDTARDQLVPTAAYRMVDYVPQLDAPVQRRGGWGYSTADLNGVSACTRIVAVAWAPFQGDPHLVCVADNGKVFFDKLQNSFGGSYVGASGFSSVTQRPFWHIDLPGLVILSGGTAPAAPQKYTSPSFGNYAVAPLGGTPPNASVGAAYGDWLLLANGTVSGVRYANRIWASAVAQPEVWNTSNDFFDLPEEIVRIVPLRNMILVFGYRQIWMLTGDTPPPGGNWTKYDLYATGAMDGRSVVQYRDTVIFANNSGVFQTDGSSLVNLTQLGGISQAWQSKVDTFNFTTGWSACGGIFQDKYVIVVHDNNGNFVTCQVCDIQTRVWYEFTNLRALMFAERQSGPGTASADGHEQLFFAHATKPRAGLCAPIWGEPYGLPPADGDGLPVLPMLETPFYKLQSPGLKQIRNVWITHDLRAITNSSYALMKSTFATYAAVLSTTGVYSNLKQWWDSGLTPPIFRVDAILSPTKQPTYVTLGTLQATQQEQRRPVWVRKRAIGVGLRIVQTQASDDTALAEIEFEARPLTRVRRG
jgi:hypothetical protein